VPAATAGSAGASRDDDRPVRQHRTGDLPVAGSGGRSTAVAGPALALAALSSPYGLFAVMTINRYEFVIEGSNDLTSWQPYEFR